MKKLYYLLVAIICLPFIVEAQNTFPASGSAGIGTITPNASSLLEMVSTSKGFLAPRMTKAQRDAIAAPATGLLMYQTNAGPGFYYYDGAAWKAVSPAGGANKTLSNLQPTSINQSLLPNANNTMDLGSSTLNWNEAYVNTIKFMDGTSQSTASAGGGSETDPQVGSNTTDFVPMWNGTALVTGSIKDNGTRIAVNGALDDFARASFYNHQSGLEGTSTNLAAVRGVNQTFSGVIATTQALGYLGYHHGGLLLALPVSSDHNGVFGKHISSTTGAGVYGLTSGSATANYGVVAAANGSGTNNYGLYARSINGTNNYAIVVPADGGNVGIGTLTPSARLHVSSTTGETAFTASVDGIKKFVVSSNGGISMFSSLTPPSNGLYINGNVGISTTAPAVKLHVAGGTDAELASGGYIISGSTSGNNIVMDDNEIQARNNGAASKLHLNYEGGDVAMSVLSGNVTIGTNTPAVGYILSVDGKVICEELKVQLSGSWPDYVFNKGYELMPLNELQSYISTHNHLPNIPSASEIENNGIEVGEMNKLMMEKIEELTLYIIELQQQMDALKNN